ncbi:unnamed protein product [Aphanomyces euteiches]
MALTMTALDPLKVVYSFTLEEKSVKFVNVLDAKIRDLQEAMATKLDLTTTWFFESTGETVANNSIQWKASTALPPGACLNSSSITLFKTGLYSIQFSGTMPYWSNGYGVGLRVGGEFVAHTPCGHDGRANSLLYFAQSNQEHDGLSERLWQVHASRECIVDNRTPRRILSRKNEWTEDASLHLPRISAS